MALTDSEYAEHKARIHRYFEKWYRALGLGYWRLQVAYVRDGLGRGENGHELGGVCEAQWQYMEASISFSVPQLAALSDDEVEETVVHELAHCLVDELACQARTKKNDEEAIQDHVERVTSSVTKALRWTHRMTAEGVLRYGGELDEDGPQTHEEAGDIPETATAPESAQDRVSAYLLPRLRKALPFPVYGSA